MTAALLRFVQTSADQLGQPQAIAVVMEREGALLPVDRVEGVRGQDCFVTDAACLARAVANPWHARMHGREATNIEATSHLIACYVPIVGQRCVAAMHTLPSDQSSLSPTYRPRIASRSTRWTEAPA